jgi:phosphatidyl-myo-inositol dimannoside synthase
MCAGFHVATADAFRGSIKGSSTTASLKDRAGRRPKILLITRNLPPLRGGMERLNRHMAEALAEWSDLTVIGPAGCRDFLPSHIETIELTVRPLPIFLLQVLRASWIHSAQPIDIVLGGSGLTVFGVKIAARRAGARSVAYVHGLDLVASHPLYRALWMPALRRLDHALANSANTAGIASRKGVARGRLTVIHPGVSLPHESGAAGIDFRCQYQLNQRPILLSVGRMTLRKGLPEFVRHALPLIRRRHPDVLLVVIGDEAPDALTGAGSGRRRELQNLAAELGMTENLLIPGPCADETLSSAYFAADVHVFPVREVSGDVEGFGMVAIEAAAHGLPTVAFATGGVPDAVHSGRSGYLIQPGDYTGFAERVCEILRAGREAPLRTSARETAAAFSWEHFAQRLRESLLSIQGNPGP